MNFAQFSGERGAFDELGAGADEGEDFHVGIWVLSTIEMYINVFTLVPDG